MRYTIKVPSVGADDNDLFLLEWQVAVGDDVVPGQVLATIETAKAQAEVPSPLAGRIVEILVEVETDVEVGMPLCVMES